MSGGEVEQSETEVNKLNNRDDRLNKRLYMRLVSKMRASILV